MSPIPIILVEDAQAKPSPSNSSRWLRVARGGLASFHPSSPTMCLHQTTLVAAPPVRNLYLAGDRSRVRHLRRRTGEGQKYRLREQGDAEHVSHLRTTWSVTRWFTSLRQLLSPSSACQPVHPRSAIYFVDDLNCSNHRSAHGPNPPRRAQLRRRDCEKRTVISYGCYLV